MCLLSISCIADLAVFDLPASFGYIVASNKDRIDNRAKEGRKWQVPHVVGERAWKQMNHDLSRHVSSAGLAIIRKT